MTACKRRSQDIRRKGRRCGSEACAALAVSEYFGKHYTITSNTCSSHSYQGELQSAFSRIRNSELISIPMTELFAYTLSPRFSRARSIRFRYPRTSEWYISTTTFDSRPRSTSLSHILVFLSCSYSLLKYRLTVSRGR